MAVVLPKDSDFRIAIASIITSSLTTLYGSSVNPVVNDHWSLSFNVGEAANSLRARAGKFKGKIHGWMVGLNAIDRIRTDVKQEFLAGAINGSLKKMGPNQRIMFRTYRVWGFHALDIGAAGSENTDNSETRLAEEIEAISDAFSLNPTLNLSATLAQWVFGHTELDFKNIDSMSFGQDQCNVAQGQITVVHYKPIINP
jgi:hypothetical protein